MRLLLDTTAPLAKLLPALQAAQIKATGGQKFVRQRQAFLADTIVAAYQGLRPHTRDPSAMAMTRDEWTEGLHGSPHRYQKLVEPFFEFAKGHSGYSPRRHYSKGYRLKTEARKAARVVFETDIPLGVRCAETNAAVDPLCLPANGLPATDGLPFTVPSILRLDLSDVDRATETLHRWKAIHEHGRAPLDPEKSKGRTIDDGLRMLSIVRAWARSLGGLGNFYTLQSHGRLGPTEGAAPHVITLPSMLRRLLLSSSGFTDFDLRACHWRIFTSLGDAYGFSTDHAQSYLANRDEWHSRLSEVTHCRQESHIKATLVSWLSGAPLNRSKFTRAYTLLGKDGVTELCQDANAKALHRKYERG